MVDMGLGTENPYGGFTVVRLTADEQRQYFTALIGCVTDARMAEFWAGWYQTDYPADYATCMGDGLVAEMGPDGARDLWIDVLLRPDFDLNAAVPPEHLDAVEARQAACDAP